MSVTLSVDSQGYFDLEVYSELEERLIPIYDLSLSEYEIYEDLDNSELIYVEEEDL